MAYAGRNTKRCSWFTVPKKKKKEEEEEERKEKRKLSHIYKVTYIPMF
jgi:hypothetical protein